MKNLKRSAFALIVVALSFNLNLHAAPSNPTVLVSDTGKMKKDKMKMDKDKMKIDEKMKMDKMKKDKMNKMKMKKDSSATKM